MLLNGIPQNLRKALFACAFLACLLPFVNGPIALLSGFLLTLLIGHPFAKLGGKLTGWLLKISVVGLGFGIQLETALQVGAQGFGITFITITSVLILAFLLGRWLKIGSRTAHLMGSGTAICGGSAIAAVGPVVNASEEEMSVSLGAIFFLNAIALIIFPYLGHWLGLSQSQFGLWSAIAIHDTSSVVGAGKAYGAEALQIATIVKLARTLWIIPLALISAFLFKSKSRKVKIPWFIGFFILAILANSYITVNPAINQTIVEIAKRGLVLTLFLIGASLSIEKIKAVGWKPLLLAIILWVFISISSLWAITHFNKLLVLG